MSEMKSRAKKEEIQMSDMIEVAARRLAAEIDTTIAYDRERLNADDDIYDTRLMSVFVRFGPLLNVVGIDYALRDKTGIVFDLFSDVDDLASLTVEAIEAEAWNVISSAVDCSYEDELEKRKYCGYGPYSLILSAAEGPETARARLVVPATEPVASRVRSDLVACRSVLADLIVDNQRLKRRHQGSASA